jgi:lipopolysaccharide transport system permease protein
MSEGAHALPAPTWVIEPRRRGPAATLRAIWTNRHFVRFLSVRTLQKIYRRTKLGWLWLFILPLFPVFLRAAVFGLMLRAPSDGAPYLIFLMAGTLCWDLFASSVMWGTRSLQLNLGMLEHVYVPRVVLPLASVAPAWVEFAIKLALFSGFIIAWLSSSAAPELTFTRLLWAPVAIALAFATALAIGLFTAVWGAVARDARLTMGQLLSVWFLATPVLYPLSAVPEPWRAWMALNPLAAAVETFRWAVLGTGQLPADALVIATVIVAIVITGGLSFYGRLEQRAEDGL